MNDATYEEKLSFKLSRMNVFVLFSSLSFFLIILTTIIIAFSSLREYIPGYSNVEDRKKLYDLSIKADSMARIIYATSAYMDSLTLVLKGEFAARVDYQEISDLVTQQPSVITPAAGSTVESFSESIFFYKPVVGVVTQKFAPGIGNIGITFTTKSDEPVKAVRDGTVIISRWTHQYGNLIAVQHRGEIISIYKKLSTLFKTEGEKVSGGEVIGVAGKTTDETNQANLVFELWISGVPVNPEVFLKL